MVITNDKLYKYCTLVPSEKKTGRKGGLASEYAKTPSIGRLCCEHRKHHDCLLEKSANIILQNVYFPVSTLDV